MRYAQWHLRRPFLPTGYWSDGEALIPTVTLMTYLSALGYIYVMLVTYHLLLHEVMLLFRT